MQSGSCRHCRLDCYGLLESNVGYRGKRSGFVTATTTAITTTSSAILQIAQSQKEWNDAGSGLVLCQYQYHFFTDNDQNIHYPLVAARQLSKAADLESIEPFSH
jgi:hypothetical protein